MTEIIQEEQSVKELVSEHPGIMEEPRKGKKNLWFLILFPIFIFLLGVAYYLGTLSSNENVIEVKPIQEEAVEKKEDVSDWNTIEYKDIGFSFKYPNDLGIIRMDGIDISDDKYRLKVELHDLSSGVNDYTWISGPGNKEEIPNARKMALDLRDLVFSGVTDLNSWAYKSEITKISKATVAKQIIFSEIEAYDVTFKRRADLYFDDYVVTLSLYALTDIGIDAASEYMEFIPEDETRTYKYWGLGDERKENLSIFYQALEAGTAPEYLQIWYDSFDKILETVSITESSLLRQTSNTNPVKVAKEYLTAYVNKDWKTAQSYVPDLNPQLAEGYGFVSYQIIGLEENGDDYEVYISFIDEDGKVWDKAPNDQGKLKVSMSKGADGNWKPLTWYFYQ
jgi:hypothetical protein